MAASKLQFVVFTNLIEATPLSGKDARESNGELAPIQQRRENWHALAIKTRNRGMGIQCMPLELLIAQYLLVPLPV